MAPQKTKRNKEMAAMRSCGYKLCEIADKYDVSRQRVLQIIGPTGTVGSNSTSAIEPWYARIIRNSNHKTNRELENELGLSEYIISKYRDGNRHALEPGSSVYIGAIAEYVVSSKMIEIGICHQLMPNNHPFDILVNDKTTIDVKSSNTICLPPSMIGRTKSPLHNFYMRTNKKSKARADFYILVILSEDIDIFIVPSIAIPETYSIRMAWPTMRPEIGKYQRYHNRWDLLLCNREVQHG